MDVPAVLNYEFYGNTLTMWLITLVALAGGVFALMGVQAFLVRRLGGMASSTSSDLDDLFVDLLRRTNFSFFVVLALAAATLLLLLPDNWRAFIRAVTVIGVVFQAASWGNGLITFWQKRYIAKRAVDDQGNIAIIIALAFLARVVLVALLFLMGLENLGINVTPLVAGLGVSGIAVALAVQNILGDLFAALSILLDKPFAVGDFIIVDDHMGVVEHIGLKSTRLRSLSGEQIIFSNADLLGSRIRNFKRMLERRATFDFGVVYHTPSEQLRRIPTLVREIVEAQPQARFDRCHFVKYGDSSLNFATVFYVTTPDHTMYLNIQQEINLQLFDRFAEMGVEFAYPTRTIIMESANGRGAPAGGGAEPVVPAAPAVT